jgi:hypothetical protein
VTLWVDGSSFDFRQDLGLAWTNHLAVPIYLGGCATAELEYWAGSRWVGGGAFILCEREGTAVRVDPGATYRESHGVVGAGKSPGYYRARGRYWTGCKSGVGISHAQCTAGPFVRSTKAFRVPKVQ